jgi:hypothetical protein
MTNDLTVRQETSISTIIEQAGQRGQRSGGGRCVLRS